MNTDRVRRELRVLIEVQATILTLLDIVIDGCAAFPRW
jgi:hypothetical protein